jgi:hypothetical protein
MYPKNFFERSPIVPEPGTCFLVMPFAPGFNAVFRSIKDVLQGQLGITCTRTDELLGGGDIIEDILGGLATSELVVVDVTGRNPNVFYELGIAHMCKPVDKVILITQEIDSIPFDLRPFRHIVYKSSTAGLRELSTELREAVDAVREKVHRILLDKDGHGVLPDRLMGEDHCLYGFEVHAAYVGGGVAKVGLGVTRYVVGVGHNRQRRTGKRPKLRSAQVFEGGLGLRLDQPQGIGGTEWSILLENGLDGKPCFRIVQTKPLASRLKPRPPVESRRRKVSAKKKLR